MYLRAPNGATLKTDGLTVRCDLLLRCYYAWGQQGVPAYRSAILPKSGSVASIHAAQ